MGRGNPHTVILDASRVAIPADAMRFRQDRRRVQTHRRRTGRLYPRAGGEVTRDAPLDAAGGGL